MIKSRIAIFISSLVCLSIPVHADDDMFSDGLDPQKPINVQVQLCSLNPSKTITQYNRNNAKYFAWAKKNNVEVTVVRSTPLFTHADGSSEPGYDFFELLPSDFETSGKAWDLWMSSEEGKKLNAEWQSIATCEVKMASLFTQWANVEALNTDDNRITTWNWCTRKDGVSAEQLTAKHRSIAAEFDKGIGNIGWFTFYPTIGGGSAPGEFANVVVYPDMVGLMKHQQWFSEGGWKTRQDYYNYVDCQGDTANTEEVRNRPGV